MVSAALAPGDVVCAFLGANTPVVIRLKPDSYYQLIRECYIHCIVNGEILKLLDFEQRLEDIVLF
jgi:hypothetical protein